jgi:hypothetical protein
VQTLDSKTHTVVLKNTFQNPASVENPNSNTVTFLEGILHLSPDLVSHKLIRYEVNEFVTSSRMDNLVDVRLHLRAPRLFRAECECPSVFVLPQLEMEKAFVR